jgi:hypothetical protein
MTKKLTTLVIGLLIAVFSFAQEHTKSLQGEGTEANPYKIYSYADLCEIDNVNYLFSAVYEVMNNFDAAASQSGEGFLPIGNSTNRFTGKFYGNGYTISNLYINRPANSGIGLFGYTENITIENLNLENINFTSNGSLGGIIGNALNETIMSSCNVTGTLTSNSIAGGLIGHTYINVINKLLTINDCHTDINIHAGSKTGGLIGSSYCNQEGVYNVNNSSSKGNITAINDVGGLIGYFIISGSVNTIMFNIDSCYSSVNINASQRSGGFIGFSDGNDVNLQISNSYATGDVLSSSSGQTGGFIGYIKVVFQIENCYSTGDVTAYGNEVGGFVGYSNLGNYSNCYATGNVSGNSQVGGFAGLIESNVTNCYATGKVTGVTDIAGFAGYFCGGKTTTNCFFNTETSGQTIFANGAGTQTNCYGKTTAQMKQQATFNGFNFTDNWQIREDLTYPALKNISNNAPFAFAVNISKHNLSFSFAELFAYDYETLQNAITIKVENPVNLITNESQIIFTHQAPINTAIPIFYRVGEIISADDTLWGNRAPAILTVNNNVSVITGFADLSTNVDIPITILPENINFTDADNDEIQEIILAEGDNYTFVGTTIIPAQDYFGEIYVPLRIFDGYEWSDEYTATIKINDAPAITSFQTLETDEDTPFTITFEMINFTDFENDPITQIFVDAGENYSVETTTITPALNYFGTLNIPVRIFDGAAWSAFEILELTINSINDAPVAENSNINTIQEVSVTTIPTVTDIDGTFTTIYIETFPQNGAVSISGVEITYFPNGNYHGNDEFQYFAKDNEGAFSNIATISIEINQNTAPEITSTAPTTATASQEYTYEVIATDAENDDLTYSLSNTPAGMIITDNVITWTPTQGTSTSGIVTVTVNDGLLYDEEDFIVFVSQVTNTAPEITSTAPTTATVAQEYTYEVIATDAENDNLTLSLENEPVGMSITDNVITWTPMQGTTNSGIITVTVSDGLLYDEEDFIVFVSSVGISDFPENEISIYPNPTKGEFKIKNEEFKIQNLIITDITGKTIQSFSNLQINEFSNFQLSIENYPNGIYFLKIYSENQIKTFKIVKN